MKSTTRETPVMSMTGASDDELIFSVDGVALQAASDSVDTVAQWPVAVPSADDLSPVGRKVLAAAQRIAFLNPSFALDLKALAIRLAAELPAVRFVLRTASPKRPTGTVEDPSWALKALRHTLLVAHTDDGEELLIEPSFRAHFALPRASDHYLEGLAAVPELLVVPPQTMRSLVQQLAARLAAETALTGRSLPPWRTASALLSKWLPVSYVDTAVLAPPQPQPAAPAYPVSSFALTSGMISPLSTSSNVSSTQSPLSLSPDSVLPYQPVLARATDLLLNKLAPVQQQQAQAAPAPAVVVVGFAVRAEKPAEVTAAAPVATPVPVVAAPIAPAGKPSSAPPAAAPTPPPVAAAEVVAAAAIPDAAPAAATALPAPSVPRTVSASAVAPMIIPPTVPVTTINAPITPRTTGNMSRSSSAAANLVAAVAASSGATPSSVAGVAAAAAAAVAAAKNPQPAGAGGGIMQMLQQQLLPSNNSASGGGGGSTGSTGAGSLASRRFGLLSKVSGGGSKGEPATAVAKVGPAAVSKVAGVLRKSKLQAVYQLLLPPVHTVKFAGAPANWEEIKAAASPHLALRLM